ncbi:hypothetical protein H4W81_005213 [Nonomuraea africana]|uniref:Uncharacterized protein n=1 Tax=Nonomuraea africana TaxID=46171 RepID=A0ABR9KK90_9ACTN|nr:hypothetical protein [Nonomuraea africana]
MTASKLTGGSTQVTTACRPRGWHPAMTATSKNTAWPLVTTDQQAVAARAETPGAPTPLPETPVTSSPPGGSAPAVPAPSSVTRTSPPQAPAASMARTSPPRASEALPGRAAPPGLAPTTLEPIKRTTPPRTVHPRRDPPWTARPEGAPPRPAAGQAPADRPIPSTRPESLPNGRGTKLLRTTTPPPPPTATTKPPSRGIRSAAVRQTPKATRFTRPTRVRRMDASLVSGSVAIRRIRMAMRVTWVRRGVVLVSGDAREGGAVAGAGGEVRRGGVPRAGRMGPTRVRRPGRVLRGTGSPQGQALQATGSPRSRVPAGTGSRGGRVLRRIRSRSRGRSA